MLHLSTVLDLSIDRYLLLRFGAIDIPSQSSSLDAVVHNLLYNGDIIGLFTDRHGSSTLRSVLCGSPPCRV